MISPSGMSVLEWMPSEAFRLAYLAGDKDRLRAATVFAEFPGGGEPLVGGRKTPPSLPAPPRGISGTGIKCQNGIDTGPLPSPLTKAPSHAVLGHHGPSAWTSFQRKGTGLIAVVRQSQSEATDTASFPGLTAGTRPRSRFASLCFECHLVSSSQEAQ